MTEAWTFVGHWEDDRIVVEYVLPGEAADDRLDDGQWPSGLWAASGTGATQDAAQAAVIAEYESAHQRLRATSGKAGREPRAGHGRLPR